VPSAGVTRRKSGSSQPSQLIELAEMDGRKAKTSNGEWLKMERMAEGWLHGMAWNGMEWMCVCVLGENGQHSAGEVG
jgi:hypothetical protein